MDPGAKETASNNPLLGIKPGNTGRAIGLLAEIFTIVAPVFICALVGFVWVKRGYGFDTEFVTKLVTNVGTPCLVFSTLIKVTIEPAAFGQMAAAALITLAVFLALSWAILKMLGLDRRAFLPALAFANVGNMGLPLCLFAFGQEGLALAITYFAIFVTVLFTVGVGIAAGASRAADLARMPILYAVAASLAVLFGGVAVPGWIYETANLLGGLTIPLMLIALGVSLAGLKITSLPRSFGLAALRLGMGFAVGWATATALGMEGAARGVLILQSSMPVAVYVYLFAARYNHHPEEVAGMVIISTVLSFATLPALLWFVL